jgi:predicted glycoside hydrolase/deacetylase ChbG (UPF0249 family)
MTARRVIVNADDFGASTGVNRGVIDAHRRGVVTSASLMVTGRAATEAATLARDNPTLSLGLHWDVWGEDERTFDVEDGQAVAAEFSRQLDAFHRLVGRLPTHVDSHKHAHLLPETYPVISGLVTPLDVPLRGDGAVAYIGGFYAQWEWLVTDLAHVSVGFLQQLLAQEVTGPWTEIACHPGYVSDDFPSPYLWEREHELATLTDPAIRTTIEQLGLRLCSYPDHASERSSRGHAPAGRSRRDTARPAES